MAASSFLDSRRLPQCSFLFSLGNPAGRLRGSPHNQCTDFQVGCRLRRAFAIAFSPCLENNAQITASLSLLREPRKRRRSPGTRGVSTVRMEPGTNPDSWGAGGTKNWRGFVGSLVEADVRNPRRP
jgi:hypothetical protein